MGTIKVCVQPEEEAIAWKACEIHVSKFVVLSIDRLTQNASVESIL